MSSRLTSRPLETIPGRSTSGELGLIAAADAAGQIHVTWKDGDALGVDRAHVGVLEELCEVGLGGFLNRHNGVRIEAHISLEALCHLADKTLEGKLADQQLRALLVLANLAQSNGSGPEAMGLHDPAGGRERLTGDLARQKLGRCLVTKGFARCLLRSSHLDR